MASSLSKLVNNLETELINLNVNMDKKKSETCENKYIKIASVFLNTETMM